MFCLLIVLGWGGVWVVSGDWFLCVVIVGGWIDCVCLLWFDLFGVGLDFWVGCCVDCCLLFVH